MQPEIEVDPQDPEDLHSFRDKQDYFQKIGERKKTKNRAKTSLFPRTGDTACTVMVRQ